MRKLTLPSALPNVSQLIKMTGTGFEPGLLTLKPVCSFHQVTLSHLIVLFGFSDMGSNEKTVDKMNKGPPTLVIWTKPTQI